MKLQNQCVLVLRQNLMLFISNTDNNSHSDVAHGVQANGVQTDLPFLFVKEEEGDEPVPPISF